MRILVTGAAGFIGYHLTRRLLADGHDVVGLDGMTPYYDIRLKQARLAALTGTNRFSFHAFMLEDAERLRGLVASEQPEIVIHLAAQAGVRYSLEQPRAYVDANVVGSFNLLEAVRAASLRHLLLASTSSIYGANAAIPFREIDRADEPLTLYAATKKAMEVMAHAHAHLWAQPTTAFRFFTVYGPWGRPDMAPLKFFEAITAGRAIDVYGHGQMARDFTFIDDLVEAIVRLMPLAPVAGSKVAECDSVSAIAPFRVVNIGGGQPVGLLDFIETLEQAIGKPALRTFLPMQPGDVPRTFADATLLQALTEYRPATPLAEGLSALVGWARHDWAAIKAS